MGLFNRKKPGPEKAEKTPTPTRRRSHIVPLEIKLLALEGRDFVDTKRMTLLK